MAALAAAPVPIKLKDLMELAGIEEGIIRSDIVGRLAAGEVKSVKAALADLRPSDGGPVLSADERALNALFAAWDRAPMAVKRAFVDGRYDGLNAILDGDEEVAA